MNLSPVLLLFILADDMDVNTFVMALIFVVGGLCLAWLVMALFYGGNEK